MTIQKDDDGNYIDVADNRVLGRGITTRQLSNGEILAILIKKGVLSEEDIK